MLPFSNINAAYCVPFTKSFSKHFAVHRVTGDTEFGNIRPSVTH